MIEENARQYAEAIARCDALTELTDDDLAQVAGGADGPGNPTDGTGRASPKLML